MDLFAGTVAVARGALSGPHLADVRLDSSTYHKL